jgi:outer membrane lipoprotein-sorting protein
MMRIRLHLKWFGLVLLAGCLLLVGWSDNWEQIRRESAGIRSVSAPFTQKKQMKILARPLVSEGRFFFQSPDSLRWEYSDPVRSILLMHGGTVRRYLFSNGGWVEETGGRLQGMGVVMQEIGQWLHGRFDENQAFAATRVSGSPTRIVLRPRDKSFAAMIQRIELTLSPRPGVIRSIAIVENEDTTTFLEFRDVKINQAIPAALFQGLP